MSTYVVGDIQGCLKPLKKLLREVAFDPGKDVLWSVGDVVNRGPKCLKTLRFLYEMRDSLVMVLGNHDLHLLAVAAGAKRPSRGDTLDEILEAPDRDDLLNWLRHRPLIHHEYGYTLVHAGIPPQWSINDAIRRAGEVEDVLRGPDCTAFFRAMYGNEPALWSDDLEGMTRLRVITNYLTRMRYCTADGVLDLESKGPLPNLGKQKVSAWFSHPQRKTANDKILFGHWASIEGKTDSDFAIGLDTGCVWGGALSFYCLETGQWTRYDCSSGNCDSGPSRFARSKKTYLVGGAVRDALLGYPVMERDWVVVGARPQDLIEQGYKQVGKDFPVFLHPETGDEYALARTERKQGHGYTGFAVNCSPQVTLEEDLLRRDLTINAMAQDSDGNIIDPYGGKRDIQAKLLRHVSEAFVEDPLRVLRTARFAARYAHLGFKVAPETVAVMAEIVGQGELAHLPAERIWLELDRALGERNPEVFIEVLRECGALAALLPELEALFGVPQTEKHHPEIDSGVHTLMALQQAVKLSKARDVRFAVLLHDLGKGTTPESEWPRHIAHEKRGVKLVQRVCKRLKAPNQYRDLALKACEFHLHAHRAMELRGKTLLKLLKATDALRRPEVFEAFLLTCEADARGRLGLEDRPYPQGDYLRSARETAVGVTAALFPELKGKALGEAIALEQVRRLDPRLRGGDSVSESENQGGHKKPGAG